MILAFPYNTSIFFRLRLWGGGILLGLLLVTLVLLFPLNSQKQEIRLPKKSSVSETLDSLPLGLSGVGFRLLSSLPIIGSDSLGPGYYEISSNSGLLTWYRIIGGNHQTPIRIRQPSFRTLQALVDFWDERLLLTSQDLLTYWQTSDRLKQEGLTQENFPCLALPETYEVYWTTGPENLTEKMVNSYQAFWNEEKRKQALALGLDIHQVCVLASIVQEESNISDEQKQIARVYWNRLQKNMRLQADPTVKFALQDFTLQRILLEHLRYDSPWNTYMYSGLPPGPINIPEKQTILHVLDSESNSYLYFCAKADFSGKHNFTESYSEHLQNAREYQQALTKLTQTQQH